MPELDRDAVIRAAMAGPDAVVSLFAGRTEAERRAVAGDTLFLARALAREWQGVLRADGTIGMDAGSPAIRRQREAMEVAVVAVGTLPELRKLPRQLRIPGLAAVDVLADRRPAWAAEWVDGILADAVTADWLATQAFWIARAAMAAGLIERPGNDYITCMIVAPYRSGSATALLAEHPDLVDTEFWRLFEVEGTTAANLAGFDKYTAPESTWATAVLGLVADGRIARERVLDATLDALARDFIAFRAGWFSRLWVALAPTDEELAARVPALLGLLRSSVATTVSFAVDQLVRAEKAGAVRPGDLVGALEPALAAAAAKPVKAALRLLERAAAAEPALAVDVAVVGARGLGHPKADVQERALRLAVSVAGEPLPAAVRAALEPWVDGVAPTMRSAVAAVLNGVAPASGGATEPGGTAAADNGAAVAGGTTGGVGGGGTPGGGGGGTPGGVGGVGTPGGVGGVGTPGGVGGVGTAGGGALADLAARAAALPAELAEACGVPPALDAVRAGRVPAAIDVGFLPDPARAVLPVAGPDELADVVARALEGRADPIDSERALDGVARLCGRDLPPELAPLVQRVDAAWDELRLALLAWRDGEVPPLKRDHYRDAAIIEFVDGRGREVAERAAARRPAARLALPTHAGGWIDPLTFVERVAALDGDPDPIDLVQALLRLAPHGQPDARSAAGRLRGDVGQLVRYALGGDERPRRMHAAAGAADWLRGTRPLPTYPLVVGRDVQSRYETVVVDGLRDVSGDPADPVAWLPDTPGAFAARWGSVPGGGRTLRLMWPAAGQWHAAHGLTLFGWGDNYEPFLEGAFDPDRAMDPVSTYVVARSLDSTKRDQATLAVDAVVATAAEGRLDSARLGGALVLHYAAHGDALARIPARLREAADVSAAVMEVARGALEQLVAALPDPLPNGAYRVLEPLNELSADAGARIAHPGARAALERFRGTSKAARLAGELLARDGVSRYIAPAALEILEARLARAERAA